jgi:hypothetical protein
MPSTGCWPTAPGRWRAWRRRDSPRVNRSQELRRFFIRRALGVTGELPQAAREPTAVS